MTQSKAGVEAATETGSVSAGSVSADDVAPDIIAKEREIHRAQVLAEGKPENIVDKIVDGKIRKWLAEITLVGQPFVKDPDMTVEKLVTQAGAQVLDFRRLEVGEGIEKKQENFAEEVMAQARGQ